MRHFLHAATSATAVVVALALSSPVTYATPATDRSAGEAAAPVTASAPPDNGAERSFRSDSGIRGHYRTWNDDAPAGNGLLVWLHGDGQYGYDHPESAEYLGGPSGVVSVAEQRNMRLIVPEAPSDNGIWWAEGARNADWLTDLIYREKRSSSTVHLAGFSGGAEEITYFVLPLLTYTGVTAGSATMFGGGGSPKVEGITDRVPKRDVSGDYPLTWIVGARDTGWDDGGFDAVTASLQGRDFYRSQGWTTEHVLVPGKSHLLSDDGVGRYGVLWSRHLP